jgi:hypothetical protein
MERQRKIEDALAEGYKVSGYHQHDVLFASVLCRSLLIIIPKGDPFYTVHLRNEQGTIEPFSNVMPHHLKRLVNGGREEKEGLLMSQPLGKSWVAPNIMDPNQSRIVQQAATDTSRITDFHKVSLSNQIGIRSEN